MIYNIETYSEFVTKILKKIPYIKTEILIRCLVNYYPNVNEKMAKEILYDIQSNGECLMSTDGWTLTKGMYYRISDDKFRDNFHYHNDYRLDDVSKYLRDLDKDDVDIMWLVADLMPDSENFIVCDTPWNIMFDVPSDEFSEAKLFQLIKIPGDVENERIELLKNSKRLIPEDKVINSIRRIALIENPDNAFKIPKLGFTHICVLDPKQTKGYRVVEKRTKDIWSDKEKYVD